MVRITSLSSCALALLTTGIGSAEATLDEGHGDPAGFTTFSAPEYPHHAIRIKQQSGEICRAGSSQWTGWLDTGGKHLFFWYFESLNDPENDPLSLWLTGGPGGSGLVGLMLELGPCLINEDGTGTVHNPYAWNSNSSMIFVDQPAGTGLSYFDKDVVPPATSYTAAEDMNIFLRLFYHAFPHLTTVPFHIVGESYGGHYIPTLAAEIVHYNTQSPAPDFKVPLASVLIGNGYVSPADTTWGFYDTLCTTKPGVSEPVFNSTTCSDMAAALPRCMYLQEACYKYPDPIICGAAGDFCFRNIIWLYYRDVGTGGRNPFDITRPCETDTICYGAGKAIETYIRSDRIRAALEIPDGVGANFSLISVDVNRAFELAGDTWLSTEAQVKYILESGVDVLIYNGELDLACNTAGNIRWANRLSWAGQVEFNANELEPWFAVRSGQSVHAGMWKQVTKTTRQGRETTFAFVTVDRSGHMVPLDQPEVGLQMVRNWLYGDFGKAAKAGAEVEIAGSERRLVSYEL